VVVGAFDIVNVETCQSSFRADRIRRYVRGHVAGNRVDAGAERRGARAASGGQGAYTLARAPACARPGIRKTMQTAIAIYYSSNKGQELRQWVRREGSKLSRAAVGALVKRDASAKTSPSSRPDRSTIAPRRVEEGHSVRSRGLTNLVVVEIVVEPCSSRFQRATSSMFRVVGAPIFGSKTCSFLEKAESQETRFQIHLYIIYTYNVRREVCALLALTPPRGSRQRAEAVLGKSGRGFTSHRTLWREPNESWEYLNVQDLTATGPFSGSERTDREYPKL